MFLMHQVPLRWTFIYIASIFWFVFTQKKKTFQFTITNTALTVTISWISCWSLTFAKWLGHILYLVELKTSAEAVKLVITLNIRGFVLAKSGKIYVKHRQIDNSKINFRAAI